MVDSTWIASKGATVQQIKDLITNGLTVADQEKLPHGEISSPTFYGRGEVMGDTAAGFHLHYTFGTITEIGLF